MSTKERHAIALLLAVGLIGHGVRLFAVGPDAPPGGVSLISKNKPISLAEQRARSAAVGRPLRPGERIDLNQASNIELSRLPGVGAGMARAIVRFRTEHGGFASLAELDSVPGVGPRLLAGVLPHLGLDDTNRVKAKRPVPSSRGFAATRSDQEGSPVVVVASDRGNRQRNRPNNAPPIPLNSASENDLLGLPGIGPAKAKAILAYRQTNGPFASVRDLEKVKGISPRLVRQLASQVVVP